MLEELSIAQARREQLLRDELADVREELGTARDVASREAARATELARHVRFWEDQRTSLELQREQLVEALASARSSQQQLLDHAHRSARDIEREARAEGRREASRIVESARAEVADIERRIADLVRFRAEVEGSIRAALARFHGALDDIESVPANPVRLQVFRQDSPPSIDEEPATDRHEPVRDIDTIVMHAVEHEPDPAAETSEHRTTTAPRRTVQLELKGIATFRQLTNVEQTILALPGVHSMWIREYDGSVARSELDVAVDQPVARLLEQVFEASVRERGADGLEVSFGEHADAAA